MNIGIIHGFIGGGGGTEKTLLTLIEALTEANHPITIYTFSKPSIHIPNVKIVSRIPFKFPFFGLYQRNKEENFLQKAKSNEILIQTSGGLVIPKEPSQKIVVYCHGDFSNELEKSSTKYRGIWKNYYKKYFQKIKKSLEKINQENIILISNSKYVQNSIEKNFKKKSHLIYPPINSKEFNKKLSKKSSVITISRFSPEKNLEFAIDVLQQISTSSIIIGNTKTKSNIVYYNSLNSKIKNESKISKITLLKNVDRNILLKNLLESKVYFHASSETFGITVVESISAGCIPIVPNDSAHLETVPFSELRYEPNNISDAQKKIQMALKGNFDHLIQPLSESVKKFDKENFKKSFLSIVDNL